MGITGYLSSITWYFMGIAKYLRVPGGYHIVSNGITKCIIGYLIGITKVSYEYLMAIRVSRWAIITGYLRRSTCSLACASWAGEMLVMSGAVTVFWPAPLPVATAATVVSSCWPAPACTCSSFSCCCCTVCCACFTCCCCCWSSCDDTRRGCHGGCHTAGCHMAGCHTAGCQAVRVSHGTGVTQCQCHMCSNCIVSTYGIL